MDIARGAVSSPLPPLDPFRPVAPAVPLIRLEQPAEAAFLRTPLPPPMPDTPQRPRRCRLWELAESLHCSIIGTCLSTGELRRALVKLGAQDAETAGEHELHVQGVTLAGLRNAGAKFLHKALDNSHATAIRHFSTSVVAPAKSRNSRPGSRAPGRISCTTTAASNTVRRCCRASPAGPIYCAFRSTASATMRWR